MQKFRKQNTYLLFYKELFENCVDHCKNWTISRTESKLVTQETMGQEYLSTNNST